MLTIPAEDGTENNKCCNASGRVRYNGNSDANHNIAHVRYTTHDRQSVEHGGACWSHRIASHRIQSLDLAGGSLPWRALSHTHGRRGLQSMSTDGDTFFVHSIELSSQNNDNAAPCRAVFCLLVSSFLEHNTRCRHSIHDACPLDLWGLWGLLRTADALDIKRRCCCESNDCFSNKQKRPSRTMPIVDGGTRIACFAIALLPSIAESLDRL